MATSGYARTNTAFGYVELSWALQSQDIANNKSTISYALKIQRDYALYSSASKSYSIVINGSTVASGTTTIGGSGMKTIKSGTTTISHNSDGTKTFNYSFSQQIDITYSGSWIGTVTGSNSGTLTTIPRTSKPSLSASSVNYGAAVTIYTNRAASFTHTLRWAWNGYSGTIATGVTTSYVWTVPLSFMDYIPNDTSSWGTIYCDTYSGSTKIGTESVKLTTNVPSNIVPSFSTITHSDTVSGASGLGIGYIQAVSKLSLAITGATGTYKSTIKSYKIEFDGSTYTSSTATTGVLKGSGSLTLKGTITDSRGRTATKSVTVSVTAYAAPKITSFTIQRCNSDGTLNDMGTYVKVTRAGTFSTLGGKNSVTIYIKSKARGTSTYATNNTSAAITGGTVTSGSVVVSPFAATSSFDFRIEFTDKFNTTASVAVLPTGLVTMSWGPSGIGIGKIWQSGALDVFGAVNIEGTVTINGKLYMKSTLDMGNANIENINHLTFNDVGGGEGIEWLDATNNWKIVVSPDDGSNATGPLQIFRNGLRMFTLGTTGRIYLTDSAGKNGLYIDGANGNALLYGYGDAKVQASNGTATLSSDTSWAKIMSAGSGADSYLQQNGVCRVVAPNTTGTYKPIYASAFTVNSERKVKKNIMAAKAGALDKIKSTNVYDYHLENELIQGELIDGIYTKVKDLDPSKVKKRKGLILEEAPEEIVFGEGIDLYAMSSMLWKAVQELSEQVNFLSNKFSNKKGA